MPSADQQRKVEEGFNRIRGRLCGLIESFGLPPSQESACKSTLKYLTYDFQKEISDLLEDTNA